MVETTFEYRVRFSDIDWMGMLHHQHYPRIFEWAREELFRSLGHSFVEHIEQDHWLAALEVSYQMRRPARYDSVLRVRAIMTRLSRARVTVTYEVRQEGADEVIATGESLHTILDSHGKVVRVPNDLLEEAARRGVDGPAKFRG